LAKIYPMWKLQFGAYKDSAAFSVLSHMSPVNSNSFRIFTILVSISLSLGLSIQLYHPFRCSNRQFMFSTHLPLSFKCSNRKFLFLSTHISSLQAPQSKLYVSQLISLLPSGVPNEIICLSTLLSPSSLQVTLIPRYLL